MNHHLFDADNLAGEENMCYEVPGDKWVEDPNNPCQSLDDPKKVASKVKDDVDEDADDDSTDVLVERYVNGRKDHELA